MSDPSRKESAPKPENDAEPYSGDDLVPEDDAVIGRALRWSSLVSGILVVVVGFILVLNQEKEPEDAVRSIDTRTPAKLVQRDKGMPSIIFTDITREAGITFIHENGAVGEKMLPETMGGGVAFLDYDSDGDQDLLFVNSSRWPENRSGGQESRMALYSNDGTGHFQDVTKEAGLDVSYYGMGVAVGDYDSDGQPDLFMTALGPNHLYRNQGGKFVEVTAQAGVAGGEKEWSSSAGFFDYDCDDDLDLFVCNYVHWSREIDLELNFTLNGKDRAYGPPFSFTGTYPYLYRNDGNGRFTDVSREAGIQINNPATGLPLAKALALLPVDVDRDGYMDVLVANDTVQNFFFHNQGGGRFEEIGMQSGFAFDLNGNATSAMGIDAAYFRNDETLAVGVGNYANEMTSFYLSQEDPLWFADESIGQGLGSPSRLFLTFGLFLFDYDLDGRLDFLQANGHIEDEIHQIQSSQTYRQAAQLFWNTGREEGAYAEVPGEQLGGLAKPIVGRGATFADIEGDGDLDVLLTQIADAPLLLRNDQRLGHHWVRIRLRQKGPNRDAIGAWISLTAEGITQRRQVMPTRSYLSQVELPVTFGLGNFPEIDSVQVQWPDGSVQDISNIPLDRLTVVER